MNYFFFTIRLFKFLDTSAMEFGECSSSQSFHSPNQFLDLDNQNLVLAPIADLDLMLPKSISLPEKLLEKQLEENVKGETTEQVKDVQEMRLSPVPISPNSNKSSSSNGDLNKLKMDLEELNKLSN